MSTQAKKEPLLVEVQCKHCGCIQPYKGDLRCRRCKKSGNLQLVKRGLLGGDPCFYG
jgi:hypothetical protein